MSSLTFRKSDTASWVIDVPDGENLMRGALDNGVEGIVGECGGALACATCHCYVQPGWLERMPVSSVAEDQMLECTAADRRPNSRLACQIIMNENLSGMIVDLPERQY